MKPRSPSISELKGHLWATGRAEDRPEDPLKKAEDALGKEWFAITAFPLFAGTFGPIASALNICALVEPWRYEFSSENVVLRYVADPSWLIGINSISLLFGVVANLAIMFVVGNSKPPLGKYGLHNLQLVLITIIGGFLASSILAILVIVASLSLRLSPPYQHAFTQAYYFAIMSAALYFITSAFVIYTAYMISTSKRSREEIFKQFGSGYRSLKLLTIGYMAYILLGALVFANIENWNYLDAVFWADVTLLTVGFGDFKPKTHLGRSLLIPYAMFGVFLLFLIIYYITNVVFEKGKSMLEIRLRDQERIRRVHERRDGPAKPNKRLSRRSKGKQSNAERNPSQIDLGDSVTSALDHKSKKERKKEQREARRRDFQAMNEIILKASRQRVLYSMAFWIAFSTLIWLVGAVVFYVTERSQNWSYFKAVYFAFISILAIGYGDESLHSMSGKAFFVLWSIIVVPTLTMLISTATQAVGTPILAGAKGWVKRRILRKEPSKIKTFFSESFGSFKNLPHNIHDKNHLLIQAIKSIALDHINHDQTKERPDYSFEDWEYIFYLMGVLNSSVDENEQDEVGDSDQPSMPNGAAMDEWQDGNKMLDWLHGKNPLNASDKLTEWMLLTLVERLEAELLQLRKQLGNTPAE